MFSYNRIRGFYLPATDHALASEPIGQVFGHMMLRTVVSYRTGGILEIEAE